MPVRTVTFVKSLASHLKHKLASVTKVTCLSKTIKQANQQIEGALKTLDLFANIYKEMFARGASGIHFFVSLASHVSEGLHWILPPHLHIRDPMR